METCTPFEEFTAAFHYLATLPQNLLNDGTTHELEDGIDTNALIRVFEILKRTKELRPPRPVSLAQSGAFFTSRVDASSGKYAQLVALLNRPHMKALFSAFDEVTQLKSASNTHDDMSKEDETNHHRPPYECVVLLSEGQIDCEQLISLAVKELGQGYVKILPDTCRPQRAGESDGNPYNFLSREVMRSGIENGAYMESGEYNGNLYGTSFLHIERAIARENVPIVWPRSRLGAEKLRQRGVRTFTVYVRHPQNSSSEGETHPPGSAGEFDDEIAYSDAAQAVKALVDLLRVKCFPESLYPGRV